VTQKRLAEYLKLRREPETVALAAGTGNIQDVSVQISRADCAMNSGELAEFAIV
jgi:hypothetical protein